MASKIAGMYDLEETLGSGHFAVVKSARHAFTGLRVAVKVIDKSKLDDVSKAHLYQEVRCMKMVTHPSIIRLFEVIDTHTKLYLIEELGDGGDLYDYIMKHSNGIEEDMARKIFRQTVSAIQYCHQLHVVHRDLKPENLVFCTTGKDMQIKLTDFGLSRTFLPGEMIESSCGSLEYSAPEVLLGDSYDPPKVDVWSLGVILYMILCGRSPFASGGTNETLTHIMDGKYDIPSHVSESCKGLMQKMIIVNPQKRASLNEVVTHPWLQEGAESDPLPPTLPPLKVSDIPPDQVELIIGRMTDGGYGDFPTILRIIDEKPYGSMAATFFLLAEAERHRRGSVSSIIAIPAVVNKKISTPSLGQSLVRSKGHVESGVLQPRRTHHTLLPPATPERIIEESVLTTPTVTIVQNSTSPYQNPDYRSPRLGVGGEQVSGTDESRKPSFPIQSTAENSSTEMTDEENTTIRHESPSAIIRGRELSACEEESETDDHLHILVPDPFQNNSLPRSQSPSNYTDSPRSRKLRTAKSSPSLAKTFSRSDMSEEDEEEDDLMELSFLPRSTNPHTRHSPFASPHLSSRNSPTHNVSAYSSDEEIHFSSSSSFDGKRKITSKRRRSRFRTLRPLVRVDSGSSDDVSISADKATRHSLPKFGKDNLRKIIHGYRSVPSTPADVSGSESLSDMLLAGRRPRSNSARTDSSLSDVGDIAFQMYGRFELSDGESGEEIEHHSPVRTNNKKDSSSITHSAICCLL